MLWPDTTTRGQNGQLAIGGQSLVDLAARFGTPLYIYDEQTLRRRSREIRDAFAQHYPHSRVVYAGKAGMIPAIVKIIVSEGLGIDVVSGGEFYTAIHCGVSANVITFHGNYKSDDELRQTMAAGIGLIAIDNLQEIDQVNAIAEELGISQAILLRLNPGIDVHTHGKIATGVVDSKFGLPIWTGDAEEAVKRVLAARHLNLLGYHAHIGSQIFDLGAYRATIRLFVEFAAAIRDRSGFVPEIISPGGGIGIAYTENDAEMSPADWALNTSAALVEACEAASLQLPELVVEPGRSIIGPAAVALYSVGSVKRIKDVRTYVSVDGGMADNIRPTLYDATYTAQLANRIGEGQEIVTIAGRYCESGDILIRDIGLPLLVPGDLLAMPAAGAYSLAMASNYNQIGRPAVILINESGSHIIRRRETNEDLLRTSL